MMKSVKAMIVAVVTVLTLAGAASVAAADYVSYEDIQGVSSPPCPDGTVEKERSGIVWSPSKQDFVVKTKTICLLATHHG